MKRIILAIVLMAMLLFTTGCFRVIETGEVGVRKTLGKIDSNEVGEGLNFFVPFVSWIEKVDVKTQEIKETANVPSNDGLIVGLEVSTIYKLDSDEVAEIRSTVSGDYRTTLLEPYIRNSIRDVVSGHKASSLYSEEERLQVASKVKENLVKHLQPRGIVIEDVLLRDIKLPDIVTNAIQKKLEADQKAQQKEFELLSAKKDAEIRIVEAGGIAEANKIISHSLTKEYIAYRFVQTLGETTNQVIYIPFGDAGPTLTRDTSRVD